MHFSLNNFKIGICFVGGTTMGKLCQICNLSLCPLSHLTWPRVARMDHLFRSHPPQWMLARDNKIELDRNWSNVGKWLSLYSQQGTEREKKEGDGGGMHKSWNRHGCFLPQEWFRWHLRLLIRREGERVCVETENHSLVDLGPGPRGMIWVTLGLLRNSSPTRHAR